MITITIDWIAVTFKDFYDANGEVQNGFKQFCDTYGSAAPVSPAIPRNGYRNAKSDANGVYVAWNDDRPEMGHHFVFSGSALAKLITLEGVHMETLLKSIVHNRGKITRIDLAKDLIGYSHDIQAIYKSLQQDGNRGTAITWNEIRKNDGGYTLYVGARTSEKFIRIYDKAKESNIQDVLWARFEIETHGLVSRAVSTSLLATSNWGDVFDTVVTAMVRPVQCNAYEQFFSERNSPIALPKIERKTDREQWIESQVIPAVCKHYIDNPNSQAVMRLIESLDLIDRQRTE